MRLDAALVALTGLHSRGAAQRVLDAGRVTVDGRARSKSHRVAAGELIELAPEPAGPERPQVDFVVAWEDADLLVIDKPAGVVVHPGAGNRHGTLVQALAGRAVGGSDPQRAGIVHRLDRDTSGLMVVAASERAYAELSRMVAGRELERAYLALVEGHPDARSGTIEAPLGRDRTNRTRMSVRTDRPRSAVTHFELLERLPRTSLLEVRLETGRTHQIRAHLEAIDHPVCGDGRYGGAASGRDLGLARQFLHSRRLAFRHPISREDLVCESKPPADLLRALEVARRDQSPKGQTEADS